MRVGFSVALLVLAVAAPAQVWEKYVAPGLTYRMEVDLETPRLIHAFRYSLTSSTLARPELGGSKVYEDNATKGRETLSDQVKRTSAIGGINADFFPFTGDPLGLMVRDRELLSVPSAKRAVFAWGRGGSSLGLSAYTITCRPAGDRPFNVDGLNQECGVNEVCLNAEVAGAAIATKGAVAHAVIKLEPGTISAEGRVRGQVEFLLLDATSVPIQPGNALLTASGNKAGLVRALQPGQKIAFDVDVRGFDWGKVEQAIGGGPMLVRNGKISLDWDFEGFKEDFSLKRHPRTAMGRTADGDLWFVAVDGRQSVSDGATLEEMAGIMLRLGCTDAINLDGGGSTSINLFGMTLNRPSEGQQRPVANAVLFFGEKPVEDLSELKLAAPSTLVMGDVLTLKVMDASGQPVPNGEVLWAAQGKVWIDQGGTMRTIAEGDAWVFAQVRGKFLMATVTVGKKPGDRG